MPRHTMRSSRLLPTRLAYALALLLLPAVSSAQLGLQGSGIWMIPAPSYSGFGTAVAAGDFNGDGIDDMAIGAADAAISGNDQSGRVHLRLTFADGSDSSGYLTSCFGEGDRGTGYRIGAALAFGDFDGDGDDDLAFGMPGAGAGAVPDAGAICVVEGGPWSFAAAPRTRYSQAGLMLDPQVGDEFGYALAAGDLDADGYADLAIGVPGEDFGEFATGVDIGVVQVLFGGPTGLNHGQKVLERDWLSYPPTHLERFGTSLAIGNFQASSVQDLAVGTPYFNNWTAGGTVTIFTGTNSNSTLDNYTPPYRPGGSDYDLLGSEAPDYEFGASLAAGDFDGDGDTDLAIGSPGDWQWGAGQRKGSVMVLYRNGGGLSDTDEQVLLESTFGFPVADEDEFGRALVAGDFNADGRDDLAVGSPLDNAVGGVDSGKVLIVYGSESGLDIQDAQAMNMLYFGGAAPGDHFGAALAAGKFFQGTGGDDLLVGVPTRTVDLGALVVGNHGVTVTLQSTSVFLDDFEGGDLSRWSASVQ